MSSLEKPKIQTEEDVLTKGKKRATSRGVILLNQEPAKPIIPPKKTETAKPKAVGKAKTKAPKKKVIKATASTIAKKKTGKVEQSVVVNVSTAKGKGRGRPSQPKPAPPADNIAQRQPLTNTIVNAIPADKNITPDPIKYLETNNIPNPKVAVKLKKGQNLYDVETELQQDSIQVKPNAKGKGLAENVEQQTEVKIQVDKPKRKYTKKIPLEPVQQFVETKAGNTDKVVSYDLEAEGTFEKNAEEGMEVKSKPSKRRGRPKKESKKLLPTPEELLAKAKKYNEESGFNQEAQRVAIDFAFGKYGNKPFNEVRDEFLSEFTEAEDRAIARRRSKIMPESEPFVTRKKNSSLSKLYENQFDADVNFANKTSNTGKVDVLPDATEFPDSNNALAPAGQDINYVLEPRKQKIGKKLITDYFV